MGLLTSVRAWLSGEQDELALELRRRGATRELWRYAGEHGGDVLGAWLECPRAPWCLEIAARCEVARPLIADAVGDLLALPVAEPGAPKVDPREWAVPPALSLKGVSGAALDEGRAAADEFLRGGDTDVFCVQMESLSFAVVEADTTVRKARAEIEVAQSFGRFREMLDASDRYDAAYAHAHAVLADVVRRRIPGELVVASLRGRSGHPYR